MLLRIAELVSRMRCYHQVFKGYRKGLIFMGSKHGFYVIKFENTTNPA